MCPDDGSNGVADEAAAAPEVPPEDISAIASLEHLTGPSRGTVTLLGASAIDIFLRANRFLHIAEARAGEPGKDLVARLHRAGDTYEIEAIEGQQQIWVNGGTVAARKLRDDDMIEFGNSGPLSRYSLYHENEAMRTTVSEILSDAIAYLRVSRQPVASRAVRAIGQVIGRLFGQTTLLFRTGVVIAILVLAGLAYQQNRLNALLEERIATGATRLENFAAALARARDQAITPGDLQALRGEMAGRLSSAAERLQALERRTSASERVIAEASPSILFLQGAYGFRETSTGRMLRRVVDEKGRPLVTPLGQPLLSLEGDGPVAERQFTGSAFAIGDDGILLSNRHVAKPWETDTADVAALAAQGLEPVMVRFIAYPPATPKPGRVELVRASDEADLAVLRYVDAAMPVPGLRLAERVPRPGDEVLVMGYPTGLRSMLAQSGDAFIAELQKTQDIGFWSIAARLAESGHIAPLASRGIVGQVTAATIVYDAETTRGGSGGPVLDIDGAVVAVNTAVLPEFGGSNLGVPVAEVRALLRAAGVK